MGCPLGEQEKLWVPICYHMLPACSSGLRDCYHNRKVLVFAINMIWREPKVYLTDCSFCKLNVTGYLMENKHKIVYSNLIFLCSLSSNLKSANPIYTGRWYWSIRWWSWLSLWHCQRKLGIRLLWLWNS